ncbi:MAG: hypothetical protein MZU79_00200 [Anaerotruncus sp.]|nr:hypothetical protein [Anaerotruncus sp.]
MDSSEMAFKIAGSLAFKKAMEQCKPILLEPIMNIDGHSPRRVHGRCHGGPQQPQGQDRGHELQGQIPGTQGPDSPGRGPHLCGKPHIHHVGPRHLHHGLLPPGSSSVQSPGKDRRGGEGS